MTSVARNVASYKPLIQEAGRKYKIPARVLAGLIDVESGGQINARSPVGAFGLTQFMPGTARSYGVREGDARSQIMGAAKYLRDLGYGKAGRTQFSLAAYNGGPGNPQYGYARKVLDTANRYKGFDVQDKLLAHRAAPKPSAATQTASQATSGSDRKALLGDYLANRDSPDALINLAVNLRAADSQAQPAPVPTTPKAKPLTRTPVPAAVPSGGAAKAVAAAAGKVGVHEQGSNNVGFLGVRGQQWCGYFATWAARQGGAKVPSMGYVPDIWQSARAGRNGFSGWSSGTRGARPGDLAVIRTGAGAHGHVGIVVSVNRDGSVNTIEGNWSDQVGRVRRKGEITGIAHVRY